MDEEQEVQWVNMVYGENGEKYVLIDDVIKYFKRCQSNPTIITQDEQELLHLLIKSFIQLKNQKLA